MKKPPTAPKHLSAAARRWWKTVTADFDFEAHHLILLQNACELWDRSQDARKQVARDGALIPDRFGSLKEHPAAKLERDSKIAFTRILRELGLDILGADEATRPPMLAGNASLRVV